MKISIIGATGGTGKELVRQALDRGHEVRALVRNPGKLDIRHERLTLLKGDVANHEALKLSMKEVDAVFCALGAPAKEKQLVRAEGTAQIIRCMEASGLKRLVCMTVLGNGESRGNLNFLLKYLVVPFYLKNAFRDHAAQEERIKESSLDWTIVRPPSLTNGPLTDDYRHGFDASAKGLKLKVSRADVAQFMLQQLVEEQYVRKTIGISY